MKLQLWIDGELKEEVEVNKDNRHEKEIRFRRMAERTELPWEITIKARSKVNSVIGSVEPVATVWNYSNKNHIDEALNKAV